jgi:hypothetical protein
MEKKIKEVINFCRSFSDAEEAAEKLTYEISLEHKVSPWRARYHILSKSDFEYLGWKVITIWPDNETFRQWLIEHGYQRHRKDDVYFNREKKELFMVSDDGVIINENFGEITIITLDEYKALLIDRLTDLYRRRKVVDSFKKFNKRQTYGSQ